jgi:hypothetical protein
LGERQGEFDGPADWLPMRLRQREQPLGQSAAQTQADEVRQLVGRAADDPG